MQSFKLLRLYIIGKLLSYPWKSCVTYRINKVRMRQGKTSCWVLLNLKIDQ